MSNSVAARISKILSLSCVSSVLSFGLTTTAHADGVEFQPMPVDVTQQCNSMILKGTERFRGTAFVVPKIFVSVNRNSERLFEISKDTDGSNILRVAVSIPLNPSAAIKNRLDDGELVNRPCDFDMIRKVQGDPNLKLAPLPISKIKFTLAIPGAQPYTVGEGKDIIDYFGVDQVLEFKIGDDRNLAVFMERLNGQIGVSLKAEMSFYARRSLGFQRIDIDMKKVYADLSAHLKANHPIAAADLGMKLSASMARVSGQIYREGSSAGPLDGQAETILKNFVDSLSAKSDGKSEGKSDGKSDAKGSIGGKVVSAEAFLNYLKSRQNVHLEYNVMGEEEEKSFLTESILHADVGGPGESVQRVSSRGNGSAVPGYIRAGETVTLDVTREFRFPLQKSTSLKMLTKRDIVNGLPALKQLFPQKMNRITEKNISEGNSHDQVAGYFNAAPSMSASWVALTALPLIGASGSLATLDYSSRAKKYTLGRVSEVASYADIRQDLAIDISQSPISDVKLSLTFSGVGSRQISFANILNLPENEYMTVKFDAFSGRISIHALKDLGIMRLQNKANTVETPLRECTVLEEESRHVFAKSTYAYARRACKTTNVPTFKSTYEIIVGRSSARGKAAATTLKLKGESADGNLVVPQTTAL